MLRLENKVAIVTGASKGIGAGIARAFAAEGAKVVVNYVSGEADAHRVVGEIRARGAGQAIAVRADVARAADVARLFAETRRAFGRLDVLVNNAGVFTFAPLSELDEAEYRRMFDINVLGTLLATREALGLFGPEGGSVINVGSVVSDSPRPGTAVYASTKGAIDTLTLALARELAPKKIRVNVIAPGGVDTEGARRAGVVGSDFEQQIIAETPLGRFGDPQDIAGVALFLASADGAWLTGERITASGGLR
jgi:3-oxoacyl-[acyl-carrier protein] reductase